MFFHGLLDDSKIMVVGCVMYGIFIGEIRLVGSRVYKLWVCGLSFAL